MASDLDVFRFIVSTLNDDATLLALLGDQPDGVPPIYDAPAPPTAVYPFVAVQHLTSSDVVGVGSERILTKGPWMVTVWDRDDSRVNAQAAYERVDTLLQQADGIVNSTTVVSISRETSFSRPSTEGTTRYQTAGGMYRATYH